MTSCAPSAPRSSSVDATAAATNFGTHPLLRANANPVRIPYLRVDVSGVGTAPVLRALLRLQVDAAAGADSDSGGVLRALADTSWQESAITYDARPFATGTVLSSVGRVTPGQQVDFENGRIRFDPGFVEAALAMVPRTFTLGSRDRELDMALDGERGFLGTDGCPADVIDLDTKKRRRGTKQDLADLTKIADALPQVAFMWQQVSANDIPVPVRPMHETHAQLLNTSKHIQQMTAIDGFNARGIVEMVSTIAGGADALRAHPILSNFQCSISPLHWDGPPIDAMRIFAEAGIPVGMCAMPLAGASAPLSVAGLMTIANAEILSGVTILQTLVPGAKTDSVYLIDENVTNEELGEYIQREASEYPFEIFLRVTVSKIDQHVYRYIVKGDWRSVKMGYGSLAQPELYDAIYLHTHPRDKRVIPNSIPDYIHAETFRNVSTLLVGSGIPIEFESIPRREDKVDTFDVDGREFSRTRVEPKRPRTAEQARRSRGDADDDARELDRIFTQNVEAGHDRVVLQNSEGMRIIYERSRPVDQRLNEVYRSAGLDLPSRADGAASRGEITQAPPSESSRPLGF